MLWGILIAAVVIALVAYLHKPSVKWTADTDGNSYGTNVDASGSFDFPLAPNSVHYVTKPCGPLTGQLTLRYRIDADPSVKFVPASDPNAPSIGPTLYFQRSGDDWNTDGFRWWATFASPSPITVGEHTITVDLNGNWTSVETMSALNNPAAFMAAKANACRVGFTFGGGTGYGHGVYATGKARFTLIALG